jgi:spore maturation protein CgeB
VTSAQQSRWFVVLSPQGAARAVGEEIIKALLLDVGPERLKVFDCRTYFKAFSGLLVNPEETMVIDLVNHALVIQCLDFRTTHMLVLPLSPVTLFTLQLIRNQHITTIHWFYEDFRQANYWKDVVAGYDYFFGIQKGPLIAQCAVSGARYAFLPTAANSVAAINHPTDRAPRVDAAFIGVPSSYRIRVLEFLASAGIRMAIAGAGWNMYRGNLERYIVNGDWTDASQSADIVSEAVIGLNLSINDPESDRDSVHISPRVFDVLQAGRVLLTEEVPLIHEVLADCRFWTFSCQEQAVEVIGSVLSHPEKERSNVEKNREIVLARHTYANRVREIMAATSPGLRPPPR